MRYLADHLYRRQNGRTHPVSSCYVPCTAFRRESRKVGDNRSKPDCIRVVRVAAGSHDLHRRPQRSHGPERVDVSLGDRDYQRNMIFGTDMGKGACRVAGRRHDKNRIDVTPHARANAVCLALLERAGEHPRAAFRPVPGERNEQTRQTEVFGQAAALVGDRCTRAVKSTADRQPVRESVEPVLRRTEPGQPGGIHRSQKCRLGRVGIGQLKRVFCEAGAGGQTLDRVVRRHGVVLPNRRSR